MLETKSQLEKMTITELKRLRGRLESDYRIAERLGKTTGQTEKKLNATLTKIKKDMATVERYIKKA